MRRSVSDEIWEKWLKSDGIERLSLIEKLGLHKVAIALKNSNSVAFSFTTLLNAYFEDLAEEDLAEVVEKRGKK